MEETATKHAPWHLIPANNEAYGRIAAIGILADRLGKDVCRGAASNLIPICSKRRSGRSASQPQISSAPANRASGRSRLKRNGLES